MATRGACGRCHGTAFIKAEGDGLCKLCGGQPESTADGAVFKAENTKTEDTKTEDPIEVLGLSKPMVSEHSGRNPTHTREGVSTTEIEDYDLPPAGEADRHGGQSVPSASVAAQEEAIETLDLTEVTGERQQQDSVRHSRLPPGSKGSAEHEGTSTERSTPHQPLTTINFTLPIREQATPSRGPTARPIATPRSKKKVCSATPSQRIREAAPSPPPVFKYPKTPRLENGELIQHSESEVERTERGKKRKRKPEIEKEPPPKKKIIRWLPAAKKWPEVQADAVEGTAGAARAGERGGTPCPSPTVGRDVALKDGSGSEAEQSSEQPRGFGAALSRFASAVFGSRSS